MKKLMNLFILIALFSVSAWSQSITDGVNHLYAERYVSARTSFEKMLASNPNNVEANYWLGQSHLATDNVAAAKQQYEKALSANANAPLILVGLGHVDLLENKTNEARQRFETAVSLSRGKKGDDPNILNAIGRANVTSKNGDVAYAIAKLNAAAQLAPANADIFINLGNAYRKAKDGGQAVTAYIKAAQANPKLGIPYYRMARIYETQRNWDIFNENLNKAISIDPQFAPAYTSQYYYNLLYKKDFASADVIAQKLIGVSDKSVENDYFRAQSIFLQKKYDEAISMGKNILSQAGANANPRVYRLLGYSYLEKGDTATSRQYIDQLFAKAKEEDFVPQDYVLKATAYSQSNPEEVSTIYLTAASEDTSTRNKLLLLQEGVQWAQTNKMKIPEADLRLALYKLNPNSNPASLFQIGLPYYQGKSFQKADSVFNAYIAAFPDSIYGYYWSANSLAAMDTSTNAYTTAAAIPGYTKTLELAKGEPRFKGMGVQASGYLATYYNNQKKDKAAAIEFLQKGLELDPENASLQNTLKLLQASPAKKAATTKPPAKKPAPKKKA
jgi:tetratricopeptide (TPR) repeat protein